ncbi:MAG: hypothetical protein H6741_31600 [Alphaproteobacteria bacterium]|nr:hypothetical protein [Alphaproteobacteria bacterium]MCB9797257.1 hypothetical protein [Alphaproteobacteria bacterium]
MRLLPLLALIGCDGAKSPADDSSGAADDSSPAAEGSVLGLSLGEAGLCDPSARQEAPADGPFTEARGPSPFGTGRVNSVALGALEDSAVITRAQASGAVDYSLDLETETYDLYVPPAYDGSEPYGLVLYINAANDGDTPGEWEAALDAHRLIRVGGEGIGNAVNVDVRMGKMVLAAYRAMELFHLDRSRVYATGTSGGARTAMVMSLLQPELIPAAFPLCGASWFEEVEQSYETQEPDSHYEYWGDFFYPDVNGQPYADFVLPYAQRFALMTSFDDFREGDILNVYHHGLIPRGLQARLLETSGGHCATTSAQVADALSFIEDPLFIEVTESSPWLDASAEGAQVSTEAGLTLTPGEGAAALLSKGRVHWASAAGLSLTLRVQPAEGARFSWILAPAAEGLAVSDLVSGAAEGWRVRVEGQMVAVDQLSGGVATTLAEGSLEDWDGAAPLDLVLHLWSQELRLEPGGHFDETTLAEGVRLLDDKRSVRVRFDELPSAVALEGWSEDVGAAMALVAEGGAVRVEAIEARDGTGYRCE